MFGIIKTEFRKQIINDIMNKNFLSNKERKLLKINKKIRLIEISNEKIINIKNEMKNELLLIKNDKKNKETYKTTKKEKK